MTLSLIITFANFALSLISIMIVMLFIFNFRKDKLEQQQQKKMMTNYMMLEQELRQELNHVKQHAMSLKKQIGELRTASMGISDQVFQLTNKVNSVVDRQDELSLQDPENKLYSRAARMVELGADIDELIAQCELPRAEAELLMRLQKK